MNIKKAAKNLYNFYEQAKESIPIPVLANGGVVYKDYVIKKNKKSRWAVYKKRPGTVSFVNSYNLKTSAILAANYHHSNSVNKMIELKNLDEGFWSNQTDSFIFDNLFKKTTDSVKKDNFLWRWEMTKSRAEYYKSKILSAFNSSFR